jgi:hypothetical protein
MAVHVLVMLEYHRTKDGFAGSVLTMEAVLFSFAKLVDSKQRHFKGVTLHLLARIIAWSPAPAEIRLI